MTEPVKILKPTLGALPSLRRRTRARLGPGQRARPRGRRRTPAPDLRRRRRVRGEPRRRGGKGSAISRLPTARSSSACPGFNRWIWDGTFCGMIGFRWQRGTSELPPHVLGHIGYTVVPWKQGRGYATQALKLLLPEARARGLGLRRTDDRPRQHPLAKGDHVERRLPARTLHEGSRLRRQGSSALAHRSLKRRGTE